MDLEEFKAGTDTLGTVVADTVDNSVLFCLDKKEVMEGWAIYVVVVGDEDPNDRTVLSGEFFKDNDGFVSRTSVDCRGKKVAIVGDEVIDGSIPGFNKVDDNKDGVVTGAAVVGNGDEEKDPSLINVSDNVADTPGDFITELSNGEEGLDDAAKDSDPEVEEELIIMVNKLGVVAVFFWVTSAVDDMWTPDASSDVLATTCVCNTFLLLLLVDHIMLKLLVEVATSGMVLFGADIFRLLSIYSIPSHSNLWATNTFPFGQTKLPIWCSFISVTLTAINRVKFESILKIVWE